MHSCSGCGAVFLRSLRHKWGREAGGNNQAMNKGCRVWIFFSSPSRHLFLFLIYLSSASEKVQTVCLVYQSTICLCFNNYTVSCKITLQSITELCLQTALLCSSMQNLPSMVGMAPDHSNAPHSLQEGALITAEVKHVMLSQSALNVKSQIRHWSQLQRAYCSLMAKFNLIFLII